MKLYSLSLLIAYDGSPEANAALLELQHTGLQQKAQSSPVLDGLALRKYVVDKALDAISDSKELALSL